MKRSYLYPVVFATLFFTACADDPTEPVQDLDPQMAVAAGSSSHIIDFNGRGPADLASRVAALGGTVLYANANAGFAVVHGLSAQGAATLAGVQGVGAVIEDVEMQVATEPMLGEMELMSAEAMSPANPATALRFFQQWGMRRIGADQIWAAGNTGSASVSIAILDTGIDYDNYDTNGLVDLDRSASFVPSDDAFLQTWFPGRHPITDFNGHGSNVASQASSNAVIYAGVNSRARLIGVKVLGRTGSGSLGGILAGLAHAADVGADVANMSLGVKFGVDKRGNGDFVGVTNKAFNYAYRQGMVVVVSAGNDTLNLDINNHRFAAYCDAPHVICVSALGPTASTHAFNGPWENEDAWSGYSNFGQNAITVSAPGGTSRGWVPSVCARHRAFATATPGVFTFICNSPPGTFFAVGYAGTSQAAPHVAGLAALVVAEVGPNNPAAVVHAIREGADDLGAPGRDPISGRGRITVPATLGGL